MNWPRCVSAQVYVLQVDFERKVGSYNAMTGAPINSSLVADFNFIDSYGIAVLGNTLYIPNPNLNRVGTYDATTGAVFKADFISGLDAPRGLAILGNLLFVADDTTGTVGKYNATTGAPIAANFVTGLTGPVRLAAAGSSLYIAANGDGVLAKYDALTGTLIKSVGGFVSPPLGYLAVSGNILYVGRANTTIGTFDATTLNVINPAFITNVAPYGFVVIGNRLLSQKQSNPISISEYNAVTGALLNPDFITGLINTAYLAALPVSAPAGQLLAANVGNNPTALAVDSVANRTYVANRDTSDISVIDGKSQRVIDTLPLPVGASPVAVVFNEKTRKLYVANSDPTVGGLVALDVQTGAATPIATPGPASTVAVNPATGVTYGLYPATNKLVAVAPGTFAVTTVDVGGPPVSLAINPMTNTVYVGTTNAGLAVIDGATLAITHTASTNQLDTVAVNPITNRVYAIDRTAQGVQVIDGETNAILATVPVTPGIGMLALNPVTNKVYVSNPFGTRVTVIDGVTRSRSEIDVDLFTQSVAVNPSTNKIYFGAAAQGNVAVVNGSTNTFTTLPTTSPTGALAINPVTNRIYVTNPGVSQVSVLDGDTFDTTAISGFTAPKHAAVDLANNRLYVTGDNATYALDGETRAVRMVGSGAPVLDAVFDPATRKLYTISTGKNELRQLDVQTGAVATVPLTSDPYTLTIDPALSRIYVAQHSSAPLNTSILTVFDGLTPLATVPLTAASDFRLTVNPATHKVYALGLGAVAVRLDEALNEREKIASVPVPVNFNNGNGPYVAVNSVTNKIYLLLYGDGVAPGKLYVLDGTTDTEDALIDVGVGPVSVAVNPSTNLIYVANMVSGSVSVIDGATNLATEVPLIAGKQPVAVEADPASDRAFVAVAGGNIEVFAGPVYLRTLFETGNPSRIAVNPITGKAYVLDRTGNRVIEIDPAPEGPGDVAAFISRLPGDTVVEPFASFTLAGVRAFRSEPVPASALFYQLDSKQGPWTRATSFGGPAMAFVNNLPYGYHTLYAYANDGAGEASDPLGSVAGAPISRIAGYTFLYRPGSFSFTSAVAQVPASGRFVSLTVRRDFTDAASVNYETLNGTALAGVNYTPVQGTLTFEDGVRSRTIAIPITDRALGAASLAFSVRLFSPTGGSRIAAPGTAAVTILDNQVAAVVNVPPPTQVAPQPAPNATGSITVSLSPPEANGQWRLFGELAWRDPDSSATGLVAGLYSVEYKPVSNFTQPLAEVVSVLDHEDTFRLRTYAASAPGQSGLLTVSFSPADSGGWRLQGEGVFRPSGGAPIALNAGSYILEFQPRAGRATPPNQVVVIADNQLTAVTTTYLIADAITGVGPDLVDDAIARTTSPYQFLGQIQTDQGFGTGFVPLNRTVATAAHVLFEDGSLSYVTGVRWFFQHELGVFEAPPQIPRGTYLFSGYASQRAVDATPGVSSTVSQQLDAAAMYFLEPAGRGGSSGFLASNSAANPWLLGFRSKLITGYPVDQVANPGRLYATPEVPDAFNYVSGALFKTTALTSFAGNSGGPLCVRYTDGKFYPAAIYLGGTEQTVVRAIDNQLVDLLQRAEASGQGGAIKTGNGIAHLALGLTGNTALTLGSLRADLTPAGAVAAGAGWRLSTETTARGSGQSALGLQAGDYLVTFTDVPGFTTPAATLVTVNPGVETVVDGDYVLASVPEITSPLLAQAVIGQSFRYQVAATVSPDSFTATPLPPGFHFDSDTGLLTGIASPAALAGSPYTIKLRAHNMLGDSVERSLVLTVSAAGQLSVTVSGNGTIPQAFRRTTVRPVGSMVSIQATPAAGQLFESWRNAATGAVLSTSALYTFTMPPQLALQATFVASPFVAGAGSYLALIPGESYELAGLMKVNALRTGAFTANVQFGGSTAVINNRFDNHGHYEGSFVLTNGRLFRLNLDLGSPAGILAGTVTESASGAQIPLLAAKSTTKAAKLLVGSYTGQCPLTQPDPALPGGTGCFRFSVTAAGGVMLSGFLGDGKPFTSASQLDVENSFPLFLVPTGGGQVVTKPAYSGEGHWLRAASANGPFAAGFAAPVGFFSSRFKAPAIKYNNAFITFSAGGLVLPLHHPIVLNSKGQTATGLTPSVKITLATGLFSGTFLDGSITRTFQGVVLQNSDTGVGFFPANNGQTGAVFLEKQ